MSLDFVLPCLTPAAGWIPSVWFPIQRYENSYVPMDETVEARSLSKGLPIRVRNGRKNKEEQICSHSPYIDI